MILPVFQSPVGTILIAGAVALAAMGLVVGVEACVPR